jgi:hypothetical protein
MKKFAVLFVILALAIATGVFAQTGTPGGGWWSGEQVQNVGTGVASIVMEAFDSQSDNTYTESKTVNPGAAYTFTPFSDFLDMPPGFLGSAVISSDQPIRAIVNITNQKAGSIGADGGKAAAQYQGTSSDAIADTLYFPLAKGNHFGKTTSFYVQNAGSNPATNVVANFKMRSGDTHTYNLPTIGPSKMVVFSVHDAATYNPAVNDDKVGSLIVTGDQPLAGVVMEHDVVGNPAIVLAGTRAFTAIDFDVKAYAPVIKNNRYGQWTGLQVQNVSGGLVDITVTYTGIAGPVCAGNSYQDTATDIADGASATFVNIPGRTNLPTDCTASATITATGNVVAIVNESQQSGYPAVATTYSAIADKAKTNQVSIPLYKDSRYGATTGLQVQNVGDADATNWTVTFECTTGGSFTAVSDPAKTGSIAPGAAYLFYTPSGDNIFEAGSGFLNGNVVCAATVDSDQPMVAIANEGPLTAGAIDNNNYEGFNLVAP